MRWFLAILLSCLTAQLAAAADLSMETTTVRHRHVVRAAHWAPYEHVVEVTIRPPSNQYIINGLRWTGTAPACFGWAPKQRVHMIAGNWHGACSIAIIRNVTLGRTCEMTCG